MDETAIINVIVNSGVVAVLFYLFIIKVSDKLDRLIETVSELNANIKTLLVLLDDRRGEKKNA